MASPETAEAGIIQEAGKDSQGQVEAPGTLTTLPVVSVTSIGSTGRGRGIVPTVTAVPGGTLRAPAPGTTEILLQALK